MVVDRAEAIAAVATLITYIGEDVARPGLLDTPSRFVRALEELTAGYEIDPRSYLDRQFAEECDELIVVGGLPFVSLCEHHMLPMTGTVTLGYIPQHNRIVGLSKLPRLVGGVAARLQVQERLTREIAEALMVVVDPLGVGVVVEATHTCMSLRGVKSPGVMRTSAMLGALRDRPEARAEFLALAPRPQGMTA